MRKADKGARTAGRAAGRAACRRRLCRKSLSAHCCLSILQFNLASSILQGAFSLQKRLIVKTWLDVSDVPGDAEKISRAKPGPSRKKAAASGVDDLIQLNLEG